MAGTEADGRAHRGILLLADGRVADARRALDGARDADPRLLAVLEPGCLSAEGDGRAARRALAAHAAAARRPLHPDLPWMAERLGAPRLAARLARDAGLGRRSVLAHAVRAALRRSPRQACCPPRR